MKCERVGPFVTAYATGELPWHTERWVAAHVETCASCSAVVARHASVSSALRAVEPDAIEPPAWLASAVVSRIEQREAHHARRMLPLPVVPPEQLARIPTEVARVLQDNREVIMSGAVTAAAAAGAAWLAWRMIRFGRRTQAGRPA